MCMFYLRICDQVARVYPDTYILCYTGDVNYTWYFYTAYLWSWNILTDLLEFCDILTVNIKCLLS